MFISVFSKIIQYDSHETVSAFQVLFSGGEGGAGIDYQVTSAYLELYAWRARTLTPTETLQKTLSPERISSSDLTIAFRQTYQTDNILIKSWVRQSECDHCYFTK
jgi:hypothetical protein